MDKRVPGDCAVAELYRSAGRCRVFPLETGKIIPIYLRVNRNHLGEKQ